MCGLLLACYRGDTVTAGAWGVTPAVSATAVFAMAEHTSHVVTSVLIREGVPNTASVGHRSIPLCRQGLCRADLCAGCSVDSAGFGS
jgi:hypothetical protein